ncbi:glutathione S-transferase LANCL1-like [Denticeps clupeoides]|uniref:glutathione S-transferase LANCL1-like n=1 Tax=Denticeps clupeoides TaxID=299321 RepID=UPI0010A4E04A|nr:glutathione S-transferase LANCL1-like [Denticeps clupeoides]
MEKGLKSADPRGLYRLPGWCRIAPTSLRLPVCVRAKLRFAALGIALLYLHLHGVFGESSYLQRALEYVSRSLSLKPARWVTLPVWRRGARGPSRAVVLPPPAARCMQLHQSVVKGVAASPTTAVRPARASSTPSSSSTSSFGQEKIPIQYIQQICDAALASGESLAKRNRTQDQSPLMYEWYQEQYVGAAHGLAGIYYFLMQPGFVAGQDRVQSLVKPSVDFVCQLKFPSGNYPPCVGDERDLLVHWCHGSPGVIYMLLQAYKVFGVKQYLEDALQSGEVLWQRGLLKKGYGLCHGAAGNAYGFLALYKVTREARHLYRACMFADWCMNYGKHGCRTPDTPFSLFEGMAGTIYFLADLLQPMRSKFPAFEV